MEIRVASAVLEHAQYLFDRYGAAVRTPADLCDTRDSATPARRAAFAAAGGAPALNHPLRQWTRR